MRRAAKVDSNQGQIVHALRQAGCSVLSLASEGNGCPDLLVGVRWRNVLLEVKRPKGRLTPEQRRFLADWKGEWWIVETVEDALQAVGVKR